MFNLEDIRKKVETFNTKAQIQWKKRIKEVLDQGDSTGITAIVADSYCDKHQIADIYLKQLIEQSQASEYKREINVCWIDMGQFNLGNSSSEFWGKITKNPIQLTKKSFYQIKNMEFPKTEYDYWVFFKILSNSLNRTTRYFYIIDNFDNITNPDIYHFMYRMVTANFHNIRIILLSSNLSESFLSEMIMKGLLYPVTQDDISFTETEVDLFFEEFGIEVTKGEKHDFLENFQGEFSSLYFALLYKLTTGKIWNGSEISQREHIDSLEKILYTDDQLKYISKIMLCKSFTYKHGLIIFDKNERMYHDFIKNSPFLYYSEFSRKYYIWEMLTSTVIEELREKDNLFYDNVYHVAEIYKQREKLIEALFFYQQINDYKNMLNILVQIFMNGTHLGENKWLYKKIGEIPKNILEEDFFGQLVYGAVMFNQGEHNKAIKYVTSLKDNYHKDKRYQDTCMIGEWATLMGIFGYMKYDNKMTEYFELAIKNLKDGSKLFKNYFSGKKMVPYSKNRYIENTDKLDNILNLVKESNSCFVSVLGGGGSGMGLLLSAEIAYLRGDFKESERYIYQCIHLANAHNQHAIILEANNLLVRICIISGERSKAFALLKLMKKATHNVFYSELMLKYSLIESSYYLAIREYQRLPEWMMNNQMAYKILYKDTHWLHHLLYAAFLYEKKHYYQIETIIEILEKSIEKKDHYSPKSYIHYLIIKAMNYSAFDKGKMAYKTIEKAYFISIKTGIIIPFIERGSHFYDFIDYLNKNDLIRSEDFKDWLDKISQMTKKYIDLDNKNNSLQKNFNLTQKEMEVLLLVGKGHTNAEIAKQIGTTLPTIKWYVHQIFSKMHVNNRTAATKEALRSGLLQQEDIL